MNTDYHLLHLAGLRKGTKAAPPHKAANANLTSLPALQFPLLTDRGAGRSQCKDADGGPVVLEALRRPSGGSLSSTENSDLPFVDVALCQSPAKAYGEKPPDMLLQRRGLGSQGSELMLLMHQLTHSNPSIFLSPKATGKVHC